jgi:hypothetical protein
MMDEINKGMFSLSGRQKFLVVDRSTFKNVSTFVQKHKEKVDDIGFPKALTQIFYVKVYYGKKSILKF